MGPETVMDGDVSAGPTGAKRANPRLQGRRALTNTGEIRSGMQESTKMCTHEEEKTH